MSDISILIHTAEALEKVPLCASTAYYNRQQELRRYVDEALAADSRIHELIGHNPLQTMYDNHAHHGAFMATVFSVGSGALLARTLPWVYRAYHNHGFSYDYFPLELQAWQQATRNLLLPEHAQPIENIYQWMLDNHQTLIALSQETNTPEMPIASTWLEQKNSFLAAALEGDHRRCLELADTLIQNAGDIENFYLHILQPVLYEVGIRWENAEISVAQEHLVSAIVNRVMAAASQHIATSAKKCGKAVIAATPNEFHEIGAAMITDILENAGWQVAYLGANIPENDLLKFLHGFKPDILALSVTLAFNVEKVRGIVNRIKAEPDLKTIGIIVGGRAFNDDADLWKLVGADAWAANLADVTQLAQKWQTA